jgi:Porin PorA
VTRRIGYVLVFVGFFLLFSALLVRFYAYPRLQKAPLNQYSQPVATGTATYFNRAQLKEVDARVQNIRTVKGDPRAGSSTTAVWDSFSVTKDLGDNGVITADQERVAMDRVTGESRNCCGDQPPHSGLTFKFPFNTQKRTYLFWDTTARRAFPANYAGSEKVDGLTTYRFEQRFNDVRLDTVQVSGEQAQQPGVATVPATIIYGNVKTLWVEPRSGIIVKAGQDVTQELRTDAGVTVLTAFKGQLVYDDATVRGNADDARTAASQLRMIQWILPIVALVLGVVLIVAGVLAIGRQPAGGRHVAGRPDEPSEQPRADAR